MNRNDIYDDIERAIAPLVLLYDMSVGYTANSEVTLHADELAQVLGNIVKQLKTVQHKLYQPANQ